MRSKLRDRVFRDLQRQPFAQAFARTNTSGSGTVTTKPGLILSAGVQSYTSGSFCSLQIKHADTSGPLIWALVFNGIGQNFQQFGKGIYCPAGVAFDFAGTTATTYGAAIEYLALEDIPYLRDGIDEPDVSEAFDNTPRGSRALSVGSPGRDDATMEEHP